MWLAWGCVSDNMFRHDWLFRGFIACALLSWLSLEGLACFLF